MAADGTVLIDTKIDADGMQKGFEQIKSGAVSVSDQVKEISSDLSSAFGGIDITKPMVKAQMKIDELKRQILSVESSLDAAAASGQTETNNADVARMVGERERLYEQLSAAQQNLALDAEFAAQREAQAAEKAAQREAVAAEKAAQREVAATKKAEKEKERAEKKRMKESTKSIRHFGSRLKEITMGAFVFNAISAGLRSVTQYMGNALKSNQAFATSLARVKGSLLTAFQPIYEAVLPALITLMNILNAVIQAIGRFFASLSGKSYSQMQQNAKALNKQAGAIGGVGDAAEDAKKQLMGFDEINKLSDTSTSGGGGGGGGTGEIAPIFDEDNTLTNKLQDILALVGAIGAGLLAWKIASAFTDSLSMAAGIGIAVAGAFLLAYNWIDAFSNGIDWGNLSGMLLGIVAIVGGLALAFGTTGAAIGLLIGGIALVVVALKEWITTGELSNAACTALVIGIMAIGGALSLFTGSWIPALLAAVVAFVIAAVTKGDELKAGFSKVIDWIKGVFARDWTEIFGTKLGTVLNNFFTMASDILDSLRQVFNGLVDFIQGVFTGNWSQAFNGIVSIAKGAVNGVISVINAMIRTVTNGINSLFSLLSFNIDLPWGGSFGLNLPQFTAPQIPYLAQGAVIPPNREFLAVLGDQKRGTNVEAPLETIKQAVAEVLSQNGSGEEITIKFTGDLATLARVLTPEITRQQRRTQRALGG